MTAWGMETGSSQGSLASQTGQKGDPQVQCSLRSPALKKEDTDVDLCLQAQRGTHAHVHPYTCTHTQRRNIAILFLPVSNFSAVAAQSSQVYFEAAVVPTFPTVFGCPVIVVVFDSLRTPGHFLCLWIKRLGSAYLSNVFVL